MCNNGRLLYWMRQGAADALHAARVRRTLLIQSLPLYSRKMRDTRPLGYFAGSNGRASLLSSVARRAAVPSLRARAPVSCAHGNGEWCMYCLPGWPCREALISLLQWQAEDSSSLVLSFQVVPLHILPECFPSEQCRYVAAVLSVTWNGGAHTQDRSQRSCARDLDLWWDHTVHLNRHDGSTPPGRPLPVGYVHSDQSRPSSLQAS
jgi:hypothetical protein